MEKWEGKGRYKEKKIRIIAICVGRYLNENRSICMCIDIFILLRVIHDFFSNFLFISMKM